MGKTKDGLTSMRGFRCAANFISTNKETESPSDPAGYDVDLVKRLQQRLVELTIELSRHKEAIHNYMSMGHAGEQDEVVQIFMDEYLPDEPEDEALSS
ncbi:MAG: hypothetical protein AB2784_16830 [Candidatus Thiodiazotropha endolucinida]